jgi:hypothetical protein
MSDADRLPYEIAARLRKVMAVVERIDAEFCEMAVNPHSLKASALVAAKLFLASSVEWKELSDCANVKELSETSRREVIAVYARRATGARRPMGWKGDL